MKYRKEEKYFTFQEKLLPLKDTTQIYADVFLGGEFEKRGHDFEDHSQGEPTVHYTELTPSLPLLPKKTNLPDPDKSKLKTACVDKSPLINQAAPRKLILGARSPAP